MNRERDKCAKAKHDPWINDVKTTSPLARPPLISSKTIPSLPSDIFSEPISRHFIAQQHHRLSRPFLPGCDRCHRPNASVRCLSCPSNKEDTVLCGRCAGNCGIDHVKTRAFYLKGEKLESAQNDESRRREYKSILHYLRAKAQAAANGGNNKKKIYTALDFVKSKVSVYMNGFINSSGGTIFFGIEERKAGGKTEIAVESVPWTRDERGAVRRLIETTAKYMCPPVPAELYQVAFVPVIGFFEGNIDERYVLEVHVAADPKKTLHSVLPPRCFSEMCEAYERKDESTIRLTPEEIEDRLGDFAVPPPIDFQLMTRPHGDKLHLVHRAKIDQVIFDHLKEKRKQLYRCSNGGNSKKKQAATTRNKRGRSPSSASKNSSHTAKSSSALSPPSSSSSTTTTTTSKILPERGRRFVGNDEKKARNSARNRSSSAISYHQPPNNASSEDKTRSNVRSCTADRKRSSSSSSSSSSRLRRGMVIENGILILGDAGTGKSIWSATHIRDSIALEMKRRKMNRLNQGPKNDGKLGDKKHPARPPSPSERARKSSQKAGGGETCFFCHRIFSSRSKMFRHLNQDGWCPVYVKRLEETGRISCTLGAGGLDTTFADGPPRAVSSTQRRGPAIFSDKEHCYFKAARYMDKIILDITTTNTATKAAAAATSRYRSKSLLADKLLAYHMCLEDDERTTNASRFVRSIAAQIAKHGRMAGIRKAMGTKRCEKYLAEEQSSADPYRSFVEGILMPLRGINALPTNGPYAILVDGLDECISELHQPSLPSSPSNGEPSTSRVLKMTTMTIPDILFKAIEQSLFPPWLLLICTARFNAVSKFAKSNRFRKVNMAYGAEEDMRRFVQSRLKIIERRKMMQNGMIQAKGGGPSSKGVAERRESSTTPSSASSSSSLLPLSSSQYHRAHERICSMSAGNFLYASMMLDAVENGAVDIRTLGHQQRSRGLFEMYEASFQNLFPSLRSYADLKFPARPLLEVLVAARRPMTERSLENTLAHFRGAIRKLRMYLHPNTRPLVASDGGRQRQLLKHYVHSHAEVGTTRDAEQRANSSSIKMMMTPYQHASVGGGRGSSCGGSSSVVDGYGGDERRWEGEAGAFNKWKLFHSTLTDWLIDDVHNKSRFICDRVKGHALLGVGMLRMLYKHIGGDAMVERRAGEIKEWLGAYTRFLPKQVHECISVVTPWHIYNVAFHLSKAAPAQNTGSTTAVDLLRALPSTLLDKQDSNGRTPVFLACQERGDVSVLELLLNAKASTEIATTVAALKRGGKHHSPHSRHYAAAAAAVTSSSSSTCSHNQVLTPLHIAARRPYAKVLKLLIDNKANVNAASVSDGTTPLMIAASKGHLNGLQLLLNCEAIDVMKVNKHGKSVLHYAAAKGHAKIVEVLLNDVIVRPTHSSRNAQQANHDSQHTLSPGGAEAKKRPSVSSLREFVEMEDVNGCSAILLAAQNGHVEVARVLIKTGHANANAYGDNAHRLPGTALWHAANNGHEDVISVLVDAKANVNAASEARLSDIKKTTLQTPLFRACTKSRKPKLEVVQRLLKCKADANVAEPVQGRTALHDACWHGKYECVELLMRYGSASPNLGEKDLGTPLMEAAYQGHADIITLLLDGATTTKNEEEETKEEGEKSGEQADPNLVDEKNLTALHYAAARGHKEAVLHLCYESVNETGQIRRRRRQGIKISPLARGRVSPLNLTKAAVAALVAEHNQSVGNRNWEASDQLCDKDVMELLNACRGKGAVEDVSILEEIVERLEELENEDKRQFDGKAVVPAMSSSPLIEAMRAPLVTAVAGNDSFQDHPKTKSSSPKINPLGSIVYNGKPLGSDGENSHRGRHGSGQKSAKNMSGDWKEHDDRPTINKQKEEEFVAEVSWIVDNQSNIDVKASARALFRAYFSHPSTLLANK